MESPFFYSPTPVPQEVTSEYLEREFRRLSAVIAVLADGQLRKVHVAPDKLTDGMIRYADGTDWDPGSGEGAYMYYNSTWNKLG